MHFLRVNIMFYDAVSVIHDIITTADQIQYTVKFIIVGVRNNKTSTKSEDERKIEYVYSVAIHQKLVTRLGKMIIFSPRLENDQFCQQH